MYYIWRCILFSAFGGRIHPQNQEHRYMCIYLGIIKLIRIKRQFKSTLNSQTLKFRQISYTLNIIRLQYTIALIETHIRFLLVIVLHMQYFIIDSLTPYWICATPEHLIYKSEDCVHLLGNEALNIGQFWVYWYR